MKWFVYNCLFAVAYLAMLPSFLLRMKRRGGYRARMGDRFGRYPAEIAARFAAALAEELPGWKETAELLAQREDKLKRRKAAPRKHTESGKRRK